MASMNDWLGFSLSPQQQQLPSHQTQQQQLSGGAADVVVSGQCFDSTLPSLNLPPPFGIFEAFNRSNNHSQDWNMKDVNVSTDSAGYKTSSSEMSMLMDSQGPKLENFLGVGGLRGCNNTIASSTGLSSSNSSNTIGLSMIKNWLRNNNNPTTTPSELQENKNDNDCDNDNDAALVANNGNLITTSSTTAAQTLSLSMSTTGLPSSSALPLLHGCESDNNGGGEVNNNNTSNAPENQQQNGAIEGMARKSFDTFGQRTSIYRGVTRHRWTGRYEAHLWDNSCRREGQTRKGRQVYLGGYDKEEKAARAYDLAALKYWGTSTTTNFPISDYEKEIEEMKHMTRQEFVASLRRKSSGFSRGASIYRGVTRHHQHGRWQARIGRVAGNKDLYLGTFSTQEEAAEAYDIAAIKFRGVNAVTNFEISRYDVKSILESSTLPIGGTAKRLKEYEQAEISLDALRNSDASISSHYANGMVNSYGAYHAWPTAAFQQAQPLSVRFAYGGQQRLWCKQEPDANVTSGFQDLHQLQLGSTHNFLQPSVLHNLMSLDSSTMEHSSGTNSVIYSSGPGDANGGNGNGGLSGTLYGNSNGYMLPMATVVADHEGSQNHINGYGDGSTDAKSIGYENMFGSTDSYQARNFYYHSQQSSNGAVKSSAYDQSLNCNTWVPTAVPTLEARTNSMAVCHGAQTFTVWNDT